MLLKELLVERDPSRELWTPILPGLEQLFLVPLGGARADPGVQVPLQHLDVRLAPLQQISRVHLLLLGDQQILFVLLLGDQQILFVLSLGLVHRDACRDRQAAYGRALGQSDRFDPLRFLRPAPVERFNVVGKGGAIIVAARRLFHLGFYRNSPRTLIFRQQHLSRASRRFQHDLLHRNLVDRESAQLVHAKLPRSLVIRLSLRGALVIASLPRRLHSPSPARRLSPPEIQVRVSFRYSFRNISFPSHIRVAFLNYEILSLI